MMNGAGLLASGMLFEHSRRAHFIGLLVAGTTLVNFWLLTGPSLVAYGGLSGAHNAVFIGGCWMRYCAEDTWS